MTWVALKSLAERRMRAVLTALAIVLGVAMIAGSFILTDTIDRAFTTIFSSSYTQTDLVVRGEPVVDESVRRDADGLRRTSCPRIAGPARRRGRRVRQPGRLLRHRQHRQDPRPRRRGHRRQHAELRLRRRPRPQRALQPARAHDGRLGVRPGEVVIDASTAAGQRLRRRRHASGVVADGPVREFTVTGIARFGERQLASAARRSPSSTSRPPARCSARPASTPSRSRPTPGDLHRRAGAGASRPLLPAGAELATGEEQAASDKEVVSEGITFIRGILLAFGGIALFVGAFVIFNTLSITVAQRSRELATLRTLGASRRQVLRSVIVEAGAIGLAASLVGLGLGFGLAKGLTALFDSVGLDHAAGRHGLRDPHRGRVAARRARDHPAGRPRARHPGDPRAADRGRPRGRRAAGGPAVAAARRPIAARGRSPARARCSRSACWRRTPSGLLAFGARRAARCSSASR